MVIIRKMNSEDLNTVLEIFLEAIESGKSTFRTSAPNIDEFEVAFKKECRLVVLIDNKIVGWCAISKYKSGCAYSGVADISIYIRNEYRGTGIGTKLLNTLIICSEKKGYWTLQSSLFAQNIGSIKLHEKCGFHRVGIRKNIGKDIFGEWTDVILMERRSKEIF